MESSDQNVASYRLEGTWRPNEDLNKTFLSEPRPFPQSLSFTKDDAVAGLVPKLQADRLKELNATVYMSGYMTMKQEKETKRVPFVLSAVFRNPHVIFWLERDGDTFGNTESFNVMLATSGDANRDLLFVGGDQGKETFIALERVPASTK